MAGAASASGICIINAPSVRGPVDADLIHIVPRVYGREHERWIAIEDWPENIGPDLLDTGVVLFTGLSTGIDGA